LGFLSRSKQLATLTVRHAVPTIFAYCEFAAAGGLMSYGLTDAYRQVGVYTGRILKGDGPPDLPVQQSTKVELLINLTWDFVCQGVFSLMRSLLSVPTSVVGSPF
jgi:putative ABC transport system substrate-binding protein